MEAAYAHDDHCCFCPGRFAGFASFRNFCSNTGNALVELPMNWRRLCGTSMRIRAAPAINVTMRFTLWRAIPNAWSGTRPCAWEENVSRLDRLNQQQEALSGGVTLEAFFVVLANYDPPLVEKTYDNFIPALPLTFTSLMFALLGFVTSFGVLSMLGTVFRGSRKAEA
jgi:hypothetical protein